MPERAHWEIIACDDDFIPPDNKLPVETRLLKYLRLWDHDSGAVGDDGRTVLQAIKNQLVSDGLVSIEARLFWSAVNRGRSSFRTLRHVGFDGSEH